jgi:molecular chaperone GrpE
MNPQDKKNTKQATEHEKKKSATIEELEKRIQDLEKQLSEQEEITKKAQYEYLNLKTDFDRRQRVKQEEAKTAHIDTLIKAISKLLPFVETLRKSLETLNDEQKASSLGQGIQMTYNKFITTLESMHIKPILAVGESPDTNKHEPVSTQSVDDEKQKGKIIAELERGFIYEDSEIKKVITTSKVIIGQ